MIQIPKTSGKYYYMSQHPTRKGCMGDVKRLGLKKGKYIIKPFSETIEPFFWEKLFNKKAKAQKKTTYVLYI